MLLGFKKQFAPLVLSGEKKQTIRAYRKRRPFRVDDTLHIYTGLQTKNCRKLGEAVCIEVSEIIIRPDPEIWVGGIWYNDHQMYSMAHNDGFKTIEDFMTFFINTHGLPFKGQLIKWDRLVGRVAL